MSSEYSISVYALARDDIAAMFGYIEQRSPTGAETWYEALLDALEKLKSNPFGRGLAHENDHVEEEIRELIFKTRRGLPYRIVFTVEDSEVRILRVRGPGQDDLTQSEIESDP